MKIIHIVASINRINFGVWNAAIFGSGYLKEQYNVDSELWVCNNSNTEEIQPDIEYNFFKKKDTHIIGFKRWLKQYNKNETIIVTHGAWLLPTRLGFLAKSFGFKWITVPHGMHEPWKANKGITKWLYFNLCEKPMIKQANAIKAVADSERINLEKKIKREIVTVYNGVILNKTEVLSKPNKITNYLFMARLHHKKGIIHLVKAWSETMKDDKDSMLLIAGPDEGELERIKPYFTDNIKYLGPVYGEGKQKLLRESHYYVLPSYSEGFPTSIVEAMSFGAIPIITVGCNFPHVFENKLGYMIEPDMTTISAMLNKLKMTEFDKELSFKNQLFVFDNLTDRKIGEDLYKLYQRLLK